MSDNKIGNARLLFVRLGYNVSHDTRMGLNRLHIWHERVVRLLPETVEGELRRARITGLEVVPHSELGFWVQEKRTTNGTHRGRSPRPSGSSF